MSSGTLVRPVSPSDSQAIPNEWTRVDGKEITPLDILRVPLLDGDACVRFQRENHFSRGNWARVGRGAPDELWQHTESDTQLLHTPDGDPIEEEALNRRLQSPREWKSLQLIHVKQIEFHQPKPDRWNGTFSNSLNRSFDLPVTDDHFTRKLDKSSESLQGISCFILLSLSPLWKHYKASEDQPFKCYKLIAGIIPVSTTRRDTAQQPKRVLHPFFL